MNLLTNAFRRFQLRRLALLIKRDLYIQYPTYLVAFGVVFGLLFLGNMASIVSAESWSFNLVFFPLILFLGGFAFTSTSFNELNQPRSRALYLSLPASNLEKFLAKLFFTGPGWAAMALIFYFLFSLVVYALTNMIFGTSHPLFDPFHASVWKQIEVYLIAQSIFLLGAATFRRNALMKTILVLLVLLAAFVVFTIAVAYLFHWFISIGGRPYISFEIFDLSLHEQGRITRTPHNIAVFYGNAIHVLLRYLLAPFLWLVAYFRLKEIQA